VDAGRRRNFHHEEGEGKSEEGREEVTITKKEKEKSVKKVEKK
jgi:hypothetical protein